MLRTGNGPKNAPQIQSVPFLITRSLHLTSKWTRRSLFSSEDPRKSMMARFSTYVGASSQKPLFLVIKLVQGDACFASLITWPVLKLYPISSFFFVFHADSVKCTDARQQCKAWMISDNRKNMITGKIALHFGGIFS